MEQTVELIEIKVRRQQILATEIDDGLMPGFALVVAIGFDHAHVFVLDPGLATRGSDDPQEHGNPTAKADPARIRLFSAIRNQFLNMLMGKTVPTFSAKKLSRSRIFNHLRREKSNKMLNMG